MSPFQIKAQSRGSLKTPHVIGGTFSSMVFKTGYEINKKDVLVINGLTLKEVQNEKLFSDCIEVCSMPTLKKYNISF